MKKIENTMKKTLKKLYGGLKREKKKKTSKYKNLEHNFH